MANERANIRLDGDRELKALLRELPGRVGKKGNRAAVTAASTPIVRAAKAAAPRESGLLKKSIGRKVKTYRGGTAAAIVGARRAVEGVYRGRKRVPANYLHLVDRGTSHSRGTQFLEDAYRGQKGEVERVAAAKFKEAVEREAAKLGKR